MSSIPQYISQRVRRPVPEGCFVIQGSTPVISFGDASRATVATLGLNPSRQEFADAKGEWLVSTARRLVTYDQLGVKALENASDELISLVIEGCYNYFKVNPYMRWFNDLELILTKGTGTSYFDYSACHLDLVQWATDPVWQKLDEATRAKLIDEDKIFLKEQLKNEKIQLILLNGRTVLNEVEKLGVKLDKKTPEILGRINCDIYVGTDEGTAYIGWSTNLQSSFGVTNQFKQALAERVKREMILSGTTL